MTDGKDTMSDGKSVDEFRKEREALNEVVLKNADLTMKRFWNLDTQTYAAGHLPKKTKELLGLVASLVLRCDDCVTYHLIQCKAEGLTTGELTEALDVGLIVGGSITIPHIRRAYRGWEELGRTDAS